MDGKYLPNAIRDEIWNDLDGIELYNRLWRELAGITGSTRQTFGGDTENLLFDGSRVALIFTEATPFGDGDVDTWIVLEIDKSFLFAHYDQLSEEFKEIFPR